MRIRFVKICAIHIMYGYFKGKVSRTSGTFVRKPVFLYGICAYASTTRIVIDGRSVIKY